MHRARRLLVIGVEDQYGRHVLKGIHAYCRLHGRWEYCLGDDNSPETLARVRVAIRRWKPDGIIAMIRTRRVQRFVQGFGIPAVNVSSMRKSDIPCVLPDNVAVGRLAARHFLDRGFKEFAFCSDNGTAYARDRRNGFVRELSEAGFGCEVFADSYTGRGQADWEQNRRRMNRWVQLLPKPAAIMCVDDRSGQAVAWACQRLGLRVPDDVGIVSVNDDETLCMMCNPPLSSVNLDSPRIGHEAARLVDQMIHGGKRASKRLLIVPKGIVTRHSSDILAIDDSLIAAAVRFIRDHAMEPIQVNDLLREFVISRRSLELRFNKAIGRTPKVEIARVRLERARNLLCETDSPIPHIARASGFLNPRKFSTFFHRETGLTPTRYRSMRRGNGASRPGSFF